MQPATASLSPLGHYSLAVPSYLQVTSPIRRYNDIIAHYQIKACLKRHSLPFTQPELHGLLPYMSSVNNKVKELQRTSESMWVLHYLQQARWENPNRKFKASILAIESVPDALHHYYEVQSHSHSHHNTHFPLFHSRPKYNSRN